MCVHFRYIITYGLVSSIDSSHRAEPDKDVGFIPLVPISTFPTSPFSVLRLKEGKRRKAITRGSSLPATKSVDRSLMLSPMARNFTKGPRLRIVGRSDRDALFRRREHDGAHHSFSHVLRPTPG